MIFLKSAVKIIKNTIMDKFKKTGKLVKIMLEVHLDPNERNKQLYESVINADYTLLGQLLLKPDCDMNVILPYEGSKRYNLFQILCSEIYKHKFEKDASFVVKKNAFVQCGKILLNHGIDLDYEDNVLNYKAIDFAIVSGEVDLVRIILNIYDKKGVSYTTRPLYCRLIKIFRDKNRVSADYMKVLKLLADKEVDINCIDSIIGQPAIYTAAKNKLKYAVNLFINKFYKTIDLDYYIDENGKSARNFILKYHLFDGHLPGRKTNPHSLLFENILKSDAVEFIECYKTFENLREDMRILLLYRALNCGALEIFEFLLDEVPEVHYSLSDLLMISCIKGFYEIVEYLLETNEITYDVMLVKRIVTSPKVDSIHSDNIDHVKCLKEILDYNTMDLNERDEYGLTIMEYAIKHKKWEMITVLIKHGSSLIVYDGKNYSSVVTQINPALIETFFNSCITWIGAEKRNTKWYPKDNEDKKPILFSYDYIVDYRSLLPVREPPGRKTIPPMDVLDVSQESIAGKGSLEESSDGIKTKVGTSKEKENVDIKTETIEIDIPLKLPEKVPVVEKIVPEMVIFQQLAENRDYEGLLTHPAANIFITMKWTRLRYYYYSYTAINVLFTVTLNLYILLMLEDDNYPTLVTPAYSLVWCTYSIVLLVEFAHIICFRKGYFLFWERVYQMFVLIFVAIILVFHFYRHIYEDVVIQLHAGTSFLSILNLFIILGNFDYFDLSVIMIKTIFFSILKLVCMTYIIFFVAFTFCMYVLWHDNRVNTYHNLGLSFFRTIVKAMGYLQIETLELDRRPLGYVVILLFCILIPMCLFNLLIGISVSDIRLILHSSQIYSQKVKIATLDKIETIYFKHNILILKNVMKNIFAFRKLNYDRITYINGDTRRLIVNGGRRSMVLSNNIIDELDTVAIAEQTP